ncbi:MAG TPA: efflux RND transporter periplasmic adaptor subunit [Dehalococcoidia bacterium]
MDDVVRLTPEALVANEISTAIAGPRTIVMTALLYGRIAHDGDHVARIKPRYSGVATSVHRRVGDQVSRGDLLATIESTASLTRYEVRSLAAGTVVKKHISVGDYVEERETLFLIVDLSTVWVDFDVFPADHTQLEVSQPVSISAGEYGPSATSTISYLAPLSDMHTQARLARVILPNPKREWLPGRLVTGRVETGRHEARVAVPPTALQRRDGAYVVFVRTGESFRSVEVELGARDEHGVEVTSGLQAGSEVANENSFLLKAELEKSEAHHDH